MPPWALTCWIASFAPITSLPAGAAYTPVSGSTIPMRTGVSPRAAMIMGDEICRAPAAAAPLSRERRSTLKVDLVICGLPVRVYFVIVRGVIEHGNDIAVFWDGLMVHCGMEEASSVGCLPPG